MKKSYLTILALAALGFAACTDSESVVDPTVVTNGETPDNAINFTSYLGGALNTRAGYNGSIDTDVLKTNSSNATQKSTDGANGFGVFAYYTGKDTYDLYQRTTYTKSTQGESTEDHEPNFMYNQQVQWLTGSTYEGYVNGNGDSGEDAAAWVYSPIKYWPNDFANGTAVDDQENDKSDNPATGSSAYGGNVSFFAYAPYVEVTPSTGKPVGEKANYNDGEDVGITALTGNGDKSDPKVTYVLYKPAVTTEPASPAKLSNVDLLWGTRSGTSSNVLNAGNVGVSGNDNATDDNATPRTYAESILGTYTTNADLTKQKTNGTIGFAFKHALAGLGGGSKVNKAGLGFQVVLDIDDMKGAEVGGQRESFTKESVDYFRTIVTIKDIEISNDLNDDNDADDSSDGEVKLPMSGKLNLATGQWEVADGEMGLVEQTIGTTASGADATNTVYAATLSKKIAEYKYYTNEETKTAYIGTDPATTLDYFKKEGIAAVNTGSHPGVTEEAQNVFEASDQAPLMFIPKSGITPTLRITVDYIVRTYDEALKGGYTTVEQKISKKIIFPTDAFQLNKHYNILMHLGLTGVKFTATVSDWDEASFTDSNGDAQIEESDIYLPRNVAGYYFSTLSATEAEATASSTATITATAVCYDTETGKTPTYTYEKVSGDGEVNTSTGEVTYSSANATTKKKETVVKVQAKVDGNVVAEENITVYQAAGALTVGSASKTTGIDAGGESVTISSVQAGGVDVATGEHSITITAQKKVGTGEYADTDALTGEISEAGKLSVVIPANAETSNVTYKITAITIDDASKDGLSIELGQSAASGAKRR